MPKIEYIGRPSLHFYGKLLSEIAKNLKNRAKGRVVIKETETTEFKEPCYYILKNVVPLMSDKVPIEPTSEEKSRMYPPYEWSAKKGLIIKPNLDRDSYLIRRSDTPGLYWRVHLAKSSKTEQDSETVS
ncbi:ribosomal protein S34 [Schistosoma haematobium]|uniref:Ribosomal protein S34 n=1 Tax=Schistosoma haematobium TaxID=6185 RepID=A0A922LUH0_SCHHA|nr:ribosomal protein S34 [Schistosoma haematobium]KAH9593993.1 ribosomal protein S34 [Schistosoma haematobium]